MNPIDLLNQLPIPAKYRKWIIYFLIPVAVFVYGIWQASGGDWKAFWPALGAAVIGAFAHAFVNIGSDTSNVVPDFDSTDEEKATPPATISGSVVNPTTEQAAAAVSNVVAALDQEGSL